MDAVYNACDLPIIGIGGIASYRDVIEFLLVGAMAVQVGTALFIEPDAPLKILSGLKQYMKSKKISNISEIVGQVRKY